MRSRMLSSIGVVALLLIAACKTEEQPVSESRGAVAEKDDAKVDYMPVANRVVTRGLGVKPGEAVLITGTPEHMELLEDLAVQVRKAGGWPTITVFSDRLTRLSYDSVPPERDADRPDAALAFVKAFPAQISLEGAGSAATLRHAAPQRLAARARAAEALSREINKMNRRVISIGNGVFPTEENARLYGMSRADLSRYFWDGVNVNPEVMQAAGSAARTALKSGKTVRITGPGGTDVTLQLAGLDPYFSDGAITDEDAKRGPQGQLVWLPAGEVYVRVAPSSATGTIVADRVNWEGEPVEGLRLELKAGRITSMAAASGLDRLKAVYDAAPAGKDALVILDIGVNTSMSVPENSRFRSFMPAGMVTLFVGNDTWAGGSNTTSFGLPIFLTGATVTVDGTPLVTNGALNTSKPAA